MKMLIEQDINQLADSVKHIEEYTNQGICNSDQQKEALSEIDKADTTFDRIITEYINISERPSLEQARIVSNLQKRLHHAKYNLPSPPLNQEQTGVRTNKEVIMVEKNVVIYSLPTCSHCKEAKEYLSQKGISCVDYDVGKDKVRAKEMIEQSGQTGTPVIFINDEMVVGFNQSKLNKLLSE